MNGFPKALYRLICLLAPEAVRSDDVEIEARTGDTKKLWKIALAVNLCKRFGLKRSPLGQPGTYGLEVVRNYGESDFTAFELLLLGGQPKHQVNDERDTAGRLLLSDDFTRGLRIGSVWNWTVVSDEVRRLLERAGLLGIQFREATGRFWELQSSIVLPKMTNTDQLMYAGYRNMAPQPFTGDYSRMVFINDPPYRSGEIHYRRSDIRQLGQFDIAQTFDLYRQPHRALAISQRFYQLCSTNGIALNVEPVRIDSDQERNLVGS